MIKTLLWQNPLFIDWISRRLFFKDRFFKRNKFEQFKNLNENILLKRQIDQNSSPFLLPIKEFTQKIYKKLRKRFTRIIKVSTRRSLSFCKIGYTLKMVSHKSGLSGALIYEWILVAQWCHSFLFGPLLQVHSKFGLNYFFFHKNILWDLFEPWLLPSCPLKQNPGVLFLFSSN